MTATELKNLMTEANVGASSVYRVSRLLGRTPYSWEVVLYSGPRGRKPKYMPRLNAYSSTAHHLREVLMSRSLIIDDDCFISFFAHLLEDMRHSNLVGLNALSDLNFWPDCDIWCRKYNREDFDPFIPAEKEECLIEAQHLMLKIAIVLKKLIYGGK